MRYLVIYTAPDNSQACINAVEWDGKASVKIPAHYSWIDPATLPAGVDIGWTWNGANWTAPEMQDIGAPAS